MYIQLNIHITDIFVQKIMEVYVTVNDDYYGGSDNIKVFSSYSAAHEYITAMNSSHSWDIINKNCQDVYEVWVVVSEMKYGGGHDGIALFITYAGASRYMKKINNESYYDNAIFRRTII